MDIIELLDAKEGENIEFKEAKESFDEEKIMRYGCALSNSGGGKIVFGITDKRPRQVVGSRAFPQPENTRKNLSNVLGIKVDFELVDFNGLRVLVFEFASRPFGLPVQRKGVAWWRDGESLVPMPSEIRRDIYNESGHDFSGDICPDASIADLDKQAIDAFRETWAEKRGLTRVRNLSYEQLLEDCEATVDGKITYAALILFGTRKALGKYLSLSETIFEYRASDASGPAQHREEFREGFFLYFDKLWELINLRNNKQHYQDGAFIFDISTFNERVVREALLNAVCHRNYQTGGSIFVRQYADRLVIESPGGLPHGVTLDNILKKQNSRNKRVAEILAKCGLVERSGQGMNIIYEQSIQEAKPLPDFTGTDEYSFFITLNGMVLDKSIILFLKKIGQATLDSFSTEDFLVINSVAHGDKIPRDMLNVAERLLNMGIIERSAQNGHYIFARRYYEGIGKAGDYTRLSGLDKGYNIGLLLKHLDGKGSVGAPLRELRQVLPSHSPRQIRILLESLRSNGKVDVKGKGNGARWILTAGLTHEQTNNRTDRLIGIEPIAANNEPISHNNEPIEPIREPIKVNSGDGRSNKESLMRCIAAHDGIGLKALQELLPSMSKGKIKRSLQRLKAEGKLVSKGRTRGALWYLTPEVKDGL